MIGYGKFEGKTIEELPIYLIKRISKTRGHKYRVNAINELKRRRCTAMRIKARGISSVG